jgi:hypothetical protein
MGDYLERAAEAAIEQQLENEYYNQLADYYADLQFGQYERESAVFDRDYWDQVA